MKSIKQISILCLVMMMSVGAKAEIWEGDCGENALWSYDTETQVLNITGSGKMMDSWRPDLVDIPWIGFCEDIKEVRIQDGITSIGNSMFIYCYNLVAVSIPGSVTTIGKSAFEDCHSLQTISLPGNLVSIGENAFLKCRMVREFIIPETCTTIGNRAFGQCLSLSGISIPSSVTSFNGNAFEGCYLVSLINNTTQTSQFNWGAVFIDTEYADGLLVKDNKAVKCRPWATSVTIPTNVNAISDKCFLDCIYLQAVDIPMSVITIGKNAFENCHSLTSVNIPITTTSIGAYAFLNCSSLTSIVIPKSITVIDEYTFQYCTSLASVTIPDGVIKISGRAFFDCSSLTSLSIPASVSPVLGVNFCHGCTGLTSLYVAWDEPSELRYDMFQNVDLSKVTLYVPIGTTDIYKATEPWYNFGQIVEWDPNRVIAYLKVKYNDNLVAELEIENEKPYTWIIPEGYTSITFNGEDVNNKVNEGTYTTPALTEDSELSITFDEAKEDVNGDGQINSLDVLKIYKYMQQH